MAENTDLSWNYWKHYDKRTMDRYLERGTIKDSDIKSRLKALPDDTENAEWIELDVSDAEFAEENVETAPDETSTIIETSEAEDT